MKRGEGDNSIDVKQEEVTPIGVNANIGVGRMWGGSKTRATNILVEGSHVHLHTRSHGIGYCLLHDSRLPTKRLSLPTRRPWIRRRIPDLPAVDAQKMNR